MKPQEEEYMLLISYDTSTDDWEEVDRSFSEEDLLDKLPTINSAVTYMIVNVSTVGTIDPENRNDY